MRSLNACDPGCSRWGPGPGSEPLRPVADHLVAFELGDLGGGQPELAQDLVIVLSHRRAGRAVPALDRREAEGRSHIAVSAHDRMVEGLVEVPGDELGMLALELGIIGRHLFVALVVMAIVTSMLSGPLIRRTLSRPKGHQLESLLSSKLFIPNLQAETSLEAIRELAALAAHQLRIDAGIIEKIAWDREQIAATGIGNGVAIPHARMPDLAEPKVVVGVSDAGVPFDAPDGQPAHVIFLLLTPKADTIAQLEISANISRLFRDPRLVERIERTQNFTEFLAVLKFESKRLSLAAG